jgi:hypothetical protein
MVKKQPQSNSDYVQVLNPQGYDNNGEITNLPGIYLVKGSRDCVIVNKEKVVSRKGFTLLGGAKTKNKGHKSSTDWETSTNITRSLRMNDDGDLEVYYNGAWELIKTYTANTRANFTPWWDGTTEMKDLLLFVIGNDSVQMWSGAIATVASNTATTITLQGTDTWAQNRFLLAGTRKVVIGGTEYAYTGGETTTTLTGLTAVPALAVGTVVMQAIREETPTDLNGLTLDLISTWNNYVVYGDLTSRSVYMSNINDYTDCAFTSPLRVPGEGALITLDSTPTAFVPGAVEDELFISGRKDDWYKIVFDLAAEQGAEQIRIKKLPTSTGQAAVTQASVVRIKNGVAFLSFEPSIDTLTRLLSINTPQSAPLTNRIKDDLLTYDLTDANGIFYQYQLFMCLPKEGKVLIYDFENAHWQAPHNLPVGRLALIDVDENGTQVLCGHSYTSNETYELYKGYNDNNAPIRCEVHFGYDNAGSRFSLKNADEYATELYMSENTVVKNRIVYDYKGATDIREFEIRGDDTSRRFSPRIGGGLGFSPFGSDPLGSLASPIDDLSKIRAIDETTVVDYFERQRIFISEGVDIRFAVIAYGDNVSMSDNIPQSIRK